jgi:hypothetical protein
MSCREDWEWGKTPTDESIQNVFIPLSLPYKNQQSPLRSMNTDAEKHIGTIDVLSFKTENGKLYFDYHVSVNPPDINSRGFTVALQIKPNQHLVVIANAAQSVGELVEDIENSHDAIEKTSMLEQLTIPLPESGKWDTDVTYRTLPMWGETDENITVDANASIAPTTIILLRMVAKIDVVLKDDATLAAKFHLKSVRLYNYATEGRIVPDASVIQKVGNDKYVTAPSLPSGYDPNRATPVCAYYDDFTTPGEAGKAMRGVIYAFESQAPDITDPLKATCLVVGGFFNGSSDTTYYRIDFIKSNENSFMDILRNHSYTITITKVEGKGYDTPEEAFEHKSTNMEVTVLDWRSIGISEIENVIFDGYYYMGIDRDSLAFSRNSLVEGTHKANNTLTVVTDYMPGWEVKSIIDSVANPSVNLATPDNRSSSWIKISSYKEDANALDKKVYIYLNEFSAADPNATRTAIITLKAGRLEYPIKVVQYNIEAVSVELYSDENYSEPQESPVYHYFKSATTPSQSISFYVRWMPKNAPLFIKGSIVQMGIPFVNYVVGEPLFGVIENGGFANEEDPKGLKPYTITTPVVTPSDYSQGYKKAANIIFSVSNGIETEEKVLTVWHEYVP